MNAETVRRAFLGVLLFLLGVTSATTIALIVVKVPASSGCSCDREGTAATLAVYDQRLNQLERKPLAPVRPTGKIGEGT